MIITLAGRALTLLACLVMPLNLWFYHANDLVTGLRWGGEPYRVLGPAPAPLVKLKGEHRAQFFMKGTHRTSMREALVKALDARPEIKRRAIVDVDPMSVL